MSPLIKLTIAGVAGGIAGNALGAYAAPKLPSVPEWVVTGGAQVITIYLALRFAGAAK